MDPSWQEMFRKRMDAFAHSKAKGMMPVSVKIRVISGCFHREHSPQAYALIDSYLHALDLSNLECRFEEHESGPEILVYLAVTTAGLTFAKSVVDLVTAIIKARLEGIKKGDRPSDPLEIIVRGHSKSGEYFEETVLRIPSDYPVTARQIQDALENKKPRSKKKKTRAKK